MFKMAERQNQQLARPFVREEAQIAADRVQVAEWRIQGKSLRDIVDLFHEDGRDEITYSMVQNDWAVVREEWLESRRADVSVYVAEELEATDYLLDRAWTKFVELTEAIDKFDHEIHDDTDEEMSESSRTVRRKIKSREQIFKEQSFWWMQVVKIREMRQRIVGIGKAAGTTIVFDNRTQNANLNVKGYSRVSPDDWPMRGDPPSLPPITSDDNDVVDGLYES